MEVILLERIEKLGQMGDLVTVKPGYARNYLLPNQKAMRATEENPYTLTAIPRLPCFHLGPDVSNSLS